MVSVQAAVERDLSTIATRDAGLAEGGIAAAALELARQLDDPDNSATSKAACSRALAEALAQLRGLVPPADAADRIDELSTRRAARRA